ncbi:unnamed protein product [Protopolystoma xenopodis]|uniref:Uncharacterized protein n=1 Tax=Protopolystoma xenopodis TaxID=117903 RepID=A0A448XPK9_9PLAT|nr:unnamed protein product [Protopolystoma xenopodis]
MQESDKVAALASVVWPTTSDLPNRREHAFTASALADEASLRLPPSLRNHNHTHTLTPTPNSFDRPNKADVYSNGLFLLSRLPRRWVRRPGYMVGQMRIDANRKCVCQPQRHMNRRHDGPLKGREGIVSAGRAQAWSEWFVSADEVGSKRRGAVRFCRIHASEDWASSLRARWGPTDQWARKLECR